MENRGLLFIPDISGFSKFVHESEIEHSIGLEGSSISNLANRVEDSLIGKNVRIHRAPMKPSAYRFMLGDNSEIGIRW